MPGKRKRETAIPLETLPSDLQRHLTALGAETVEDYLDWCRAHGLQPTLRKTPRLLAEELEHATRLRHGHSLHHARGRRRPERVLRRILAGDCDRIPASMEAVCTAIHGNAHPQERRAFNERLLRHLVKTCPRFLRDRAGRSNVLALVLEMGEHHDHAVRQVESWRPRSHNAERNLTALARHLFARWEVPAFLDAAWHEPAAEVGLARAWYLHIGSGRSIRTADLPIPYTKKMAHHFLRAPRDYSAAEALRWGQVHGLGGDARLAGALRGTRLCDGFAHDEFWSSVLRFFIRNPFLDRAHLGPIVDFLHHNKFQTERFVDGDGRARTLPPPLPGLSMRGRTAESLLAQVEAWHRRLGRGGREADHRAWPSSGFLPFHSVEGTGDGRCEWRIHELTSPAQLQREGAKMRHCVATYAGSCRGGRSSIWTLERAGGDGVVRKLVTIEVRNAKRQIVQARGPCNQAVTPQARAVMQRWACAVELTLASWV